MYRNLWRDNAQLLLCLATRTWKIRLPSLVAANWTDCLCISKCSQQRGGKRKLTRFDAPLVDTLQLNALDDDRYVYRFIAIRASESLDVNEPCRIISAFASFNAVLILFAGKLATTRFVSTRWLLHTSITVLIMKWTVTYCYYNCSNERYFACSVNSCICLQISRKVCSLWSQTCLRKLAFSSWQLKREFTFREHVYG